MRDRSKSLLQWVRSEFKFILLVIIIIVAAIMSFSYAYLRGKSTAPVADTATEVQTRQFEAFEAVEPEPTPESSPSTETPPPTPQPSDSKEKTPSSRPKGTLGAKLDCDRINAEASRQLLDLERRLKDALSLDLNRLYNDTLKAYDSYKREVEAKGCRPTAALPKAPKKLL